MADKFPVTFGDRTVEFNAKQKLVKESDAATGTVNLFFRNGVQETFTIPETLRAQFAVHGAEQKLGDAMAGVEDIDDGVESIREMITRLNAGDWNVRREGGSGAGSSILLRALVEASGKTPEAIREFLSSKSQAEKLALRNTDALKPIITRLEAEKAKGAKTQVDTASLLGDLGISEDAPKAKKAA
jgi:hypothetical protein